MKSILIGVFPSNEIFILVATLLAIFAVLVLVKTSAQTPARHRLVVGPNIPFPTGAISQIALASDNSVFARLFHGNTSPTIQPISTGSISQINRANQNPMFARMFPREAAAALQVAAAAAAGTTTTPAPTATSLPTHYAGPVVVQGSKYMWESKWSHLPSFEQGREGEERVVNTMMNTLGNGWHIFRNFVLPTENEDIDLVLVGPAGVFAMEVNSYSGEIQSERSRCYRKTKHGHVYSQRRGPGGQVRHNAARLNAFLQEHGIDSRNYVKPMVVMSGDSSVEVAAARTDVCTMSNLRPKLSSLASQTKLSTEQVRTITGVLQASAGEQMRFALSRVH